jgi:hypothetical protein
VANNIPAGDTVQVDLLPVAKASGGGGGKDDVDELMLTVRNLPPPRSQLRNDGESGLYGGGGRPPQLTQSMSGHYSPPHQNMLPRNHVIGSRARLGVAAEFIGGMAL